MIKGCLLSLCCLIVGTTLSSCGYRLCQENDVHGFSTMSLPYVKGDMDGKLTTAIIEKLNSASKWSYVQDHADLVLDIEILRKDNDYVGYQYDRVKSTGELINRLIPNEGRRKIAIQLKVFDRHKQELLYGPYEVEASADYDFVNFDTYKDLAFVNQEGVAQSVLTFSLGQLDAQEGGVESVLSAVYQTLAEKIIQGLNKL